MSIDLVVKNEINEAPQFIEDQNGNISPLQVSTSHTYIVSQGPKESTFAILSSQTANPIMSVKETTNGGGNLFVKDETGTTKVRLVSGGKASFINNGNFFGVGTEEPTAMLDVAGDAKVTSLTIAQMLPTSQAPDPAKLESVHIDPETGILYYQ